MQIFLFSSLFFLVFYHYRAAPTAYGGSQARGPIGAVAASLHSTTAMPDSSHVCDLHYSSWQCRILNPLSEARDRTCVYVGTSQLCFCCATMGAPLFSVFCSGAVISTSRSSRSLVCSSASCSLLSIPSRYCVVVSVLFSLLVKCFSFSRSVPLFFLRDLGSSLLALL